MAGNVVRIRILGDAKGLKNATDDAGDAIGKLENRSMNLSRVLAVAFSAGVVVRFAADTVKAASDIEESLNKLNVLLGESQPEVVKWASTVATSFGISRRTALETAGTFANMFEKLDRTQPEIAQMSKGMVELAADMASFNNTSVDDALTALMAGLRGESMPLRRFGVLLDEATLKERAMNLGLRDTTTGVLPPLIRLQASYAEILSQTTLQQGDFTRTAASTANQTKTLAAELDDLKVAIGEQLTPAAKNFIRTAREWIPTLTLAGESVVDTAKKFGLLSTEFAALAITGGVFVGSLAAQQKAIKGTNSLLEGLGRTAVNVKGPYQALGAALVTLAAVGLTISARKAAEAKQTTEELAEALRAAKDPTQQFADRVVELNKALQSNIDATKQTGDAVTEFDAKWALGKAERDDTLDLFNRTKISMDELADAAALGGEAFAFAANESTSSMKSQEEQLAVLTEQFASSAPEQLAMIRRLYDLAATEKISTQEMSLMLGTLAEMGGAFDRNVGKTAELSREFARKAVASGLVTQEYVDQTLAVQQASDADRRWIATGKILEKTIQAQGWEIGETVQRTGDYIKKHGTAAEQARILRQEIDELTESYQKEQEAILESINADLALESASRKTGRAERDLQKKYTELAEAQAEYAEGSDEVVSAKEAVEDATENLIDQAVREAAAVQAAMEGQNKTGEAAFTAAEMTDAYVAKLRELRDRFTDPAVKSSLDEMITRLDKNATSAGTAAAAYRELDDAVKRLRRNEKVAAFAELGLIAPPEEPTPSPPGRAAGGPVSANRPYVVGEAGPELFVPQRSGSIVPNGQLGGGQVTINIMTPIGRPDDVVRWVREELRKLDRGQR